MEGGKKTTPSSLSPLIPSPIFPPSFPLPLSCLPRAAGSGVSCSTSSRIGKGKSGGMGLSLSSFSVALLAGGVHLLL